MLPIYKTALRTFITKIRGNSIARIPAIGKLKRILPAIAVFIKRFLIRISLFFKIFIKRPVNGFCGSCGGVTCVCT